MNSFNNSPVNVNRWKFVILGIIIMMCLGTVYSWSVFREAVETRFNIGSTQSGLPYMVSLAFYAIFMFVTGKYLDKYNPAKIINTGAFALAIGWILSSIAPNIYILTLTYGVLGGIGMGIAYGAPMTVVSKWFPEKKGLAVGLVLVGFGLSPFVTAPLAGYLIKLYGLVNTFAILGFSFAILIPILSFSFKYPEKFENKISNNKDKNALDMKKMIKTRNFKGLYFNFTLGTMIGLTVIGLSSSAGIDIIGLDLKTVSLFISLFAVCNGIGRPLFGYITDIYGSKKTMILSYILMLISSLVMLKAEHGSVVLFTLCFSIFWMNLGAWLAIAPASTINMFGASNYSQNYGLVFTGYGLGAISGVLASGILLDVLKNYNYVFYLISILCILGLLSSVFLIDEK